MSAWAAKVKAALKDPRVLQGISAVAAEWMEEHIQQNMGRGPGGTPVEHKPLKTVTAQTWTTKRQKKGVLGTRLKTSIVTTRRRIRKNVFMVIRRKKLETEYLVETTSFRAGGQPLRDTGDLARSLGATATSTGTRIRLGMLGNRYGLYQDRGFKTKGPNYIPLTKRGKRGHGTGQNPIAEGLTRNKDFKMAWKGVTVPSRPFILPTRDDMLSFGRSIYLGLKAVLKGQ